MSMKAELINGNGDKTKCPGYRTALNLDKIEHSEVDLSSTKTDVLLTA